MEEIKSSDGVTIAIIARKNFAKQGINFFTEDSFPLQLGVNSYKKGHKIKGHIHQKRRIVVNNIQEVLYIKSGKVLVTLYDLNNNLIKSTDLSAGDLIFFADGGHGIEMTEDTTFIEVKQGPYFGKDKDKEIIE